MVLGGVIALLGKSNTREFFSNTGSVGLSLILWCVGGVIALLGKSNTRVFFVTPARWVCV